MNRTVAKVAAYAVSTIIAGSALAVDLPYTGGRGDPLGLTSSNNHARPEAACRAAPPSRHVEIPYTGGKGDPLGLTSSTRVLHDPQMPHAALCDSHDRD